MSAGSGEFMMKDRTGEFLLWAEASSQGWCSLPWAAHSVGGLLLGPGRREALLTQNSHCWFGALEGKVSSVEVLKYPEVSNFLQELFFFQKQLPGFNFPPLSPTEQNIIRRP